jgi:3',5'-cyclic AMP phosphodiesterase CpdA
MRQIFFGLLVLLQDAALPLTFGVYGDMRDGHDVHAKIAAQLLKAQPALVVSTGDYVRHGDNPEMWSRFQDITRSLRRIPYYPARGNHDLGPLYLKQFGLKKTYYVIDRGPVRFLFVDTNTILSDPEQMEWLEKTLADGKFRYRFVVQHHPPFTLIAGREDTAQTFREKLHPLYVKHRVTAVFCGHDHLFYQTIRDGVTYVVTGGGGAPLYDYDESRAERGDRHGKFYHYLLVTAEASRVTATVFDPDARQIDTFTIAHD